MIIYKVTCKINGKVYVGQTRRRLLERKRQHERQPSSGIFDRAIKKYGVNNFNWEVVEICSSLEELNYLECYYIKYFETLSPNGYNLHSGGNSFEILPETRLRMGSGMRNKKHKSSTIEKMSLAGKNRKHSEETKSKIKAAKTGYVYPTKRIQIIDLITGLVWSSCEEVSEVYGYSRAWASWHINHAKYKRFIKVEAANE